MTALERGQLGVMRIHAWVGGLLALGFAFGAEAVLGTAVDLPLGSITVPVLILGAYPVLLAPGRRYRAWGYRIDAEELHVAHGIWTRIETVVPLARVQHVDVSQGPVERCFGVSRLVLHTAGTMNSRVVLPGLSRETAEAVREDVRARIRRDVL